MTQKFIPDHYILIIDDSIDEKKSIRDSIARAFNKVFEKKEITSNEFEHYVSRDNELNILEVNETVFNSEKSFAEICTLISTLSYKIDVIIIDIHLKRIDENIFNSDKFNKDLDIDLLLSKFKELNVYEKDNDIPLSLKLLYWIKNSPITLRSVSQVLITSTYFNEYKKNLFLYFGANGLMERDYFNKGNEKMLYDFLRLFISRYDEYYQKLIKKNDTDYLDVKAKIESYNKKFPNEQIICNDSKSLEIIDKAIKAARSNVEVLIRGENGVGKEAIAKFIHGESQRSQNEFIIVNCAGIPSGLLESELFGHEKGAFTGAHKQQIGKFELAKEGTIFLDEIGDMEISLQAKILRVVQDKKIERVGGGKLIESNVRIISATNKDLDIAVKEKKFREDLLYRLSTYPIIVPPLRERKKDIPPLVHFFVKKHQIIKDQVEIVFDQASLFALQLFDWPGNIRQLENIIRRILTDNYNVNVITLDKLPSDILYLDNITQKIFDLRPLPTLEVIQNIVINHVLNDICGGNQTRAARILGISRGTLISKLKKD